MDQQSQPSTSSRTASSGSSTSSQQDRGQRQTAEGYSGDSSNASSSQITTSPANRTRTLTGSSPTASAARRHPSISSSLSNVTNYSEAGEGEGGDSDEAGEHSEHGPQADGTRTLSSQAWLPANTSPPMRPISAFTRAGSGLPLASTSTQATIGEHQRERSDAQSAPSDQASATITSSGIEQQRLAAAGAHASKTDSDTERSGASDNSIPASSPMSFANVTRRRTHAPSLGAFSQSSSSSFGSSSSSPPTSHFSSNAPGSTRLGTGPLSDGALSPPTSVGTGTGGSTGPSNLQQREHAHHTATAPIAFSSATELANIGIGISNAHITDPHSTASSAAHFHAASDSTPISSMPSGPASLPAMSSMPPPLAPLGAASVTTRLSSTPFLPSPLAQASLAPGEEEGEQMDVFGLDAMPVEDDLDGGQLAISTGDRPGRSSDASSSSFTNAVNNAPASLRRSMSVSHTVGYKSSASRRRISSISQQQQQASSSQTTTSLPALASATSPPGSTSTFTTPASAAAAAAAATQRPGSPSPLRKEASLLSLSRNVSTVAMDSSAPTRSLSGKNGSGSSSDASSSTSGVITHSPTPRVANFQPISIPATARSGQSAPSSAVASSSGGNNSPLASSSSDSPLEFQVSPPHQALTGLSGPTSAFRSRQMSVSSSGSASSANSAPARAQPGHYASPTMAVKTLSPPTASLSMSASSPGLSYHVPSGSHRSNSISIHSRGTHGRSESLSSALGISTAMGSSPSSASSAALSTSPSASFRPFPSAPPVATPSAMSSSSFNFSPSSSVASPAVSPPGLQNVLQSGLSPSTSFTSSSGGRAEAAGPATGPSGTSGGIRLQRVPTSVRLAQELHPMSPVTEKRRLSIDPSSSGSTAMVASASSLSAFKIGGPDEQTSSSSSGSETEYKARGTSGAHHGLQLPATPMATRRNTPSPSGDEEDAGRDLQAQGMDATQYKGLTPAKQGTGLASPFSVHGTMQELRQRSPSGSPSNISPSHSSRSLSIPTPPLQNTSAYAPLFPFSVPRSAARTGLSTTVAQSGSSSSPPSLSRSHSRSRSKGQGSPIFNRLSPRMSTDPFGSNADSSVPAEQTQSTGLTASPRMAAHFSNPAQPSSVSGSGALTKRNTISGLAASSSASSLFEPAYASADSHVPGSLSPPFKSPRPTVLDERITSPASMKKQFRTSMMPGSISTSSTEDYARHLQESRASKLRKWAAANTPSDGLIAEVGGAGNTIGAGSDIQAAGSKARRRAGIPDFADFGYASERSGKDYRDDLAGDLGIRPGTAGSREIEWVDWLDEYKKMKEAKIRAEREQEEERQKGLANLEEAAEAEGDDIALEMYSESSVQVRRQSADYSPQDPLSRRSSEAEQSEHKSEYLVAKGQNRSTLTGDFAVAFPHSREPDLTPDLDTTVPPRPRRLSTASLASLSLLDASKRKRTSQDSLGGAVRPAIPAAVIPRKPLAGRSISYAPPTAYSAMRQDEPQGQASALPKKRKNIASKIDAWWSAVTKSFSSSSDDKKSPPPPPPPMTVTASVTLQSQLPPLPRLPPLTTEHLMPAVSIDPADLPGRVSAQYGRGDSVLPVPPSKLRHTASASDLTPEKKVYGGGQLPTGALAPAARVPTHFEHHQRLSSANSDGDNSNSSGGAGKSDSKRRNPQSSLRLDPRFQPAGTAHRLGDRPSASRTSSTSWSSSSGPPSQPSMTVFKEPRPPASVSRQAEQTPSLTPGQSPIWDRTPGLVPMSQTQDLRLVRSASKSSSLMKTPATTPAAPLAPTFSMSHIREHIKHRLSGAKHNCDKELKKIITGITVYVEKELENERAFASGLVSRQEEADPVLEDRGYSESPAPGLVSALESEVAVANDDGGQAHDSKSKRAIRPELAHTDTGSSVSTEPPGSGMGSPTMTYGQHFQSRHQQKDRSAQRGRSSGHASPKITAPSRRHPVGGPVRPADLAARLERSLDLEAAARAETVKTTSTSTSRSRSPMAGHRGGSAVNRTSSAEWFKKQDAPEEDDKRNFLHSLQEIVTIAMEIQDTSVAELTDDPSACAHLIRRVQKIGQRWDDHPNWPLRGWYVQLLLAVAGLSRVAEFWAEERGFWNFEDQKDANDNEPILFVAKTPAQDEEGPTIRPRSRAASTVLGLGRAPGREERTTLAPSPLGIDLGVHRVEEEAPADTSLTVSAPPAIAEETSRADEAEVLREAVEEVRSATILMELALDGISFQYLSPVWEDVVGLPPNVCLGRPISHLLHPDDAAVFAEASRHLQQDDSHTIEAQFRLRVFGENEDPDDHTAESFKAMEGKGMLIRDRVHGGPSHTMWVIRPVPAQDTPSDDGEATTVRPPTASYIKSFNDSLALLTTANDGRLPVQPILCRICDRQIPTWFFEKHNETCNETHRLEVDIGETNDRLADLRAVISDILERLKASYSSNDPYTPPEYQDLPLLPQRYRDSQMQVLEELSETLNIALQVSTPSLADDNLPVEQQRLLSPTSEDHLSFLQGWQAPKSEDPALRRLADDLAESCRQKMTAVNRLRNTIVYVERVRLEWELQAQAVLANEEKETHSQSPPPSPAPTILPTSVEARSATARGDGDAYEHPTPILPKPQAFVAQGTTVPVQQLPDRESPLSFENVSPAALLQPLPMVDAHFGIPADNAASGQARTLSPSLIPTSPRLASAAPVRSAKSTTSIKDFDIIKPISKGAFGSVYLAKKRNTGDYYAIKVLKKADMIAKNQVTNVKAERKIMMTQADSDFAVKLYWTFQSKDYLYLVMEYLNGGDCASLIKVIGCLDEDWAKSYVAEIVLGLEYLHSRGIVHRDLKPDNLLIDSRGHLRLTDFGLSRFGLLGRQARTINQSSSQLSKRLHRRTIPKTFPQAPSEHSTPDSQPRPSYFGSHNLDDADAMSESSGSESVPDKRKSATTSRNTESPALSMGSSSGKLLPHVPSPAKQSDSHRFVGTVDYVAPESILGVGVGEGVDWWALGVICHEFLTSFPPFHADTPEQVFDNILSRRIDWHDEDVEWSPEARDFVDRLLCPDPTRRLGAKGAEEVKRHDFLRGIDWTKLRESEGNFVPQITDPESTDYFDDRGAASQVFQEEPIEAEVSADPTGRTTLTSTGPALDDTATAGGSVETPADDFGTFNFKNLDVLKQANDDVIRKLRSDSVIPPGTDPSVSVMPRKARAKRSSVAESRPGQPPSPSTSTTSSVGSGFSRPSLPNTPFAILPTHKRAPSHAQGSRLKTDAADDNCENVESFARRSSMPSNVRRASLGTMDKHFASGEGNSHQRRRTSGYTDVTPASSISSPAAGTVGLPPIPGETSGLPDGASAVIPATEKTVDCLIAEDNPISSKILETILVRLGCLCVVVHNGEEAIRCSMGELAFDVIFMDMLMPILDGENAARMIKSTNNANQHTPIVAVTSYAASERTHITEEGTLFNAVLTKPVSKMDVLNVLTKLGFVTKAKTVPGDGAGQTTNVDMVRSLTSDVASAT